MQPQRDPFMVCLEFARSQERPTYDAHTFWIGSSEVRSLIRNGRLTEAAPIIREMRKSAKFLLAGSTNQNLGRRMHVAAQELFTLLVETRNGMGDDLARAAQ